MKKKKIEFTYIYKDGSYLQTLYMGDGEYELVLVKDINSECLYNDDWSLSDILRMADGVYDENGNFICQGSDLDIADFTKQNIDLKVKKK